MTAPKLRMVAGPNGSGKTTLLDHLFAAYALPLGYRLNPDEIDHTLEHEGRLDFAPWGVAIAEETLRAFVRQHPLGAQVAGTTMTVRGGVLSAGPDYRRGYLAAILGDFLRGRWLATGQSFTFETVMSSPAKLLLLEDARRAGYRTYLYYVCTDSPVINRERVISRVAQGGHDVPAGKLESRYERSLGLLPEAIRLSHRAYLFDNSGKAHRLVAEFDSAKLVRVADPPPAWFISSWLAKQNYLG